MAAGKQMRAVIVGAGTLLGKELAEELNDSAAVAWETRLLDEAAESEAQLSADGDEAVVLHRGARRRRSGLFRRRSGDNP